MTPAAREIIRKFREVARKSLYVDRKILAAKLAGKAMKGTA